MLLLRKRAKNIMMTNARVAAQSTEFIVENFAAKDFNSRTEVWDNGSITVSHTVTLPVGNLQAVIKVSADEKFVSVAMILCSDAMMTTTALYSQNDIRPEEFDSYMNYHLSALMNLADEYLERVANDGPDALWTITLDPEDDLEPTF